jgi:hypothetical protein
MYDWGRATHRLFGNGMTRRALTLALAAGMCLTLPAPAAALADTLDQSQTVANSSVTVPNTQMLAQTFTAGMSGQLDKLSLFIGQQFASGGESIQVQSVAGGKPSGVVLGGTSTSGVLNPAWKDFPLSPAASVTAGTQYAIVLIPTATSGNTSWTSSKTVTYAGGQEWTGVQATSAWTAGTMSFAFKTWVLSGTNQAPSVAAANGSVSVNEGGTLTNSGTYSDPDGDTVAVTASAGNVTQTGTSSGTWSWTQAAADEVPGQTISITANDGNGNTAVVTFTTTVNPVAPTAQINGAPATAAEGSTVALTGSATSPSAADTVAGFTYNWTVTKNGQAYVTGTGAAFSFQPNDEGVYVVNLLATDDGAFSGTASATINGTNAAPSATIPSVSPSDVVLPKESVTFNGHFSDPGPMDSHVVTWTFGDGATYSTTFGAGPSADFSVSHAFAKAGTYNVGLQVVDDDGASVTTSTKTVVGGPAQALAGVTSLVQSLPDLKRSQRNSMLRQLASIGRSLQHNNIESACDQTESFLERLNARHDERHLSAADAAALTTAMRSLQTALGCPATNQDVHES